MTDAPEPLARVLAYLLVGGLLPLWVAAGVADWWCHRRLRIEHTAGWPESALHLAMLAELGIGIVVAALCRVNAAVLVLLFGLCVLHDVTLVIDLAYAERRRRIPPAEQWVHGVQQAMPWACLAVLAVLYHPQAFAAVGAGAMPADWHFVARATPLPPAAWAVIGVGGAVVWGAFLGEAWRGWCARPEVAAARR